MNSPPLYSSVPDSLRPPEYTTFPQGLEQTLSKSALTTPPEPRDARLTIGAKFGSVTFTSQPRGTTMPTYGRGDVIDGCMNVRQVRNVNVFEVRVKVEGCVRLSSQSSTLEEYPFLSMEHALWTATAPTDTVPANHPFSIPLPATVDDDGAVRPLPPTFRSEFDGVEVSVEYICTVIALQSRTLPGFTKEHRITTPLRYMPRSRPPRPSIESDHEFLSTVKIAPDEWGAVGFSLKARHPSGDLRCEFAFPSSRIYAALQKVPVHMQMLGQAAYLHDFLSSPRSYPEHSSKISRTTDPVAAAKNPTLSAPPASSPSNRMSVYVHIERRVAMVALSGSLCHLQRLAEAHLESPQPNIEDGWVAWDGHLNIGECDTTSFQFGPLTVSDQLVFAVRGGIGSDFRAKDLAIPVRIVTDPFPPAT
ncbi:hypothetical protein EXIGLDRAFT_835404 [Exidia glandulosa HHB12029]|uniref:Arrestin-like N-terminal domain-containing protein n=1 Tax=Exidia glandulosa HHB12029 TaxID=1314781 RepID=A0A165IS73_EXIGL|nr:hypothetical protein EXIGLDRAFT_835404 [Exidia glandulosa HHB12029]